MQDFTTALTVADLFPPPPSVGGLDLDSRSSGCARLGGEVGLPLGVVVEEVAVLVILVRRHRHAVRAAVRRAVDDELLIYSFARALFSTRCGVVRLLCSIDLERQR